jgi:undecaprenyl-diphosphatase
LGYFFLLTALFLYIGEHYRLKRPALATGASAAVRYRLMDALMIGVAQGAALLPGVSRSGATISAATYLGWSRADAARFSFLMAIPTICGGMLLQAVEVLRGHDAPSPLSFSHYAIGACVAFVVGWLALSLLIKLSKGGTFKVFYWYCLLLGALTLFFASGR